MSSLSQLPGMPQIIPLFGATTVERVQENSKLVLLDAHEMNAIQQIQEKIPVQGHRWPAVLQQFEDK